MRTEAETKAKTAVAIPRDISSLPTRRAGVLVLRGRCDFILSWPAHIVAEVDCQHDLSQTTLGRASRWQEYVPHDE